MTSANPDPSTSVRYSDGWRDAIDRKPSEPPEVDFVAYVAGYTDGERRLARPDLYGVPIVPEPVDSGPGA